MHEKAMTTVNPVTMSLPVPKTLKESAELRKHDPELLSLDGEIAMLRAAQELIVVKLNEEGELDPMNPSIDVLLNLANKIGTLVERSHRIQMDRKMVVPAHRVVAFIEAVAKALKANIEDQETIDAIYKVLEDADDLA